MCSGLLLVGIAEVVGSNPTPGPFLTVIELRREQVAGCSKNSRPMTLGAYMHDSMSFFTLAQSLGLWLR
jgi:hypothetical protein